ncbi:FecR family protein [Ancylomarina sp.]|uniref:FecR family protein n=1 Tax=Ancylomarina sp. TaxID=1970196 RepID=UPI00356B28B5
MKETKEHILLAELLVKEVTNKLSDDEKEQLNPFLLDENKKQMIDSARESIILHSQKKHYKDFDIETARQKIEWKIKFKKKSKMRRLYNAARLAAVLALPIAITTYMTVTFFELNESQYAQVPINIKKGEAKAILYLSDGSSVDLDTKKISQIEEADGSLILKDSTGLNYTNQSNEIIDAEIQENVVVTPAGGEYQLTLSDGTKVWMNALSEIRYPVKFSGDSRKVAVSGEVFFDVAKNKDKPFYVSVGDVDIKVLGTQFNVMAYPDEENIETTLVEGSVRLMSERFDKTQTEVDLVPGHKANFNRSTKAVEITTVNTDIYTAWKDGKFVFESANLDDIMRKLERRYNVKVFFENQDMKNLRFSARLSRYGNIEDVLYKMEQTTSVKFIVKDDHVIVRKKYDEKFR